MNYTIRIFGRDGAAFTTREVAEAATEGVFLEEEPIFAPDPGSAEAANPVWHSLVMRWDPMKQPIVFNNHFQDGALHEEIRRLMLVLEIARKTEPRQKVVDHLQKTIRMFSVELNRAEMTDDTWAMLDAIESRVAKRCAGIVFTPDEGFFDSDLKRFYKL